MNSYYKTPQIKKKHKTIGSEFCTQWRKKQVAKNVSWSISRLAKQVTEWITNQCNVLKWQNIENIQVQGEKRSKYLHM